MFLRHVYGVSHVEPVPSSGRDGEGEALDPHKSPLVGLPKSTMELRESSLGKSFRLCRHTPSTPS